MYQKHYLRQILAMMLCVVMLLGITQNAVAIESESPSIKEIIADKAMYSPGETVTFAVTIDNSGNNAWAGNLNLSITHLETTSAQLSENINVAANETSTVLVRWTLPLQDYTGYLVKAYIGESCATTAVDCSSDLSMYPRYGYISSYSAEQSSAKTDSMIEELASKYHVNAYQLYDWMWRHETLIKRNGSEPAASWNDLFNRTISVSTISDYIDAIHAKNGYAMAYVMSYAAHEGYTEHGVDPRAGLFTDQNHASQLNVDFGDGTTYLWLFNPENETWQQTMIEQYLDAINTLNFDGLQIDQMGQRNNVYDYRGQQVYLEDTFSTFVNAAKNALTANNSSKDIVTFNIVDGTVDGWAMDDVVKNASTDFNFSEIWWLSNNYNDIKNYIEQVRKESGGKALVLAAYMNYNDNCGEVYEAEEATLAGTTTNTDHTGYSGSGFVDGFETPGDRVTFTITAPESGLYSFVFTYANAGDNATRKIYVDNDIIDEVSFGSNASWDEWCYDANCSTYLSAGTHTVAVSYDAGCTGAINLDKLTLGTFDENSVRLTDAMLAACGAFHIELGAGDGQATMLSHEYYPMNAKAMRSSLQEAMKQHYDFITAYENLLFDPDLSYADTGTQYLNITGENVSGSGEAGKIWFIARQSDDYNILHLINLTGETNTEWRDATNAPVRKENLAVKYYIGENVSVNGVYLASPDTNNCETQVLPYITGTDSNGAYISFTIPSLEYWDMIYIRRTASSAVEKYEAENALKTNVAVNTNHTGYSGAGFVDSFADYGDSVAFTVSVPSDDTYTLRFRYSNGTESEAARSVIVDGSYANKAYFVTTSDWDTWSNAEVGVSLAAGVHTIVVYYGDYEYGAINLDYMIVEPCSETSRSLYMNNWNNLVAIWQDTVVNQATVVNGDGPSLYELRYYDGTSTGNYNTNNIKNYSTFLRDRTASKTYTDGAKFSSSGYYDTGGILVNTYNTYDGTEMPFRLIKSYAMVPNEQFIIVQYNITNTAATEKTIDILDMLHVNNASDNAITASYSATNNAMTVDMSAADQPYIAHGILCGSRSYSYQVANDSVSSASVATCSPWHTFNENGTLNGNTSVTCQDISTGLSTSVTLAAGESDTLYYYIALAETSTELASIINKIQTKTGAEWVSYTRGLYSDWLEEGNELSLEDQTLNDAYQSISVFMKQSIVPGVDSNGTVRYAAFPATTNPSAYSYKVWARDSAVTAMGLDATGHLDEAENYWYWLADRQITTDEGGWKQPGTFWTCYWIWDNSAVSFVEPEYDSIGMFLVGAYRHYEQLDGTDKTNFLNSIWPAYRRSADYVLTHITDSGLGPADCSIWEEQSEYNTFTQALYVAGLDAAQYMAAAKGLQDLADQYNGGASTIRTAIMRDDTDAQTGLWNTTSLRFNRAVNLDGTANTTYDSSSDVLISYGVVDAESSRAKSHIDGILANIGHDVYGVARYENDGFYHRMPWDPGGNEAYEDEPSWPQMAMWIAMYEIQSGYESYRINAYRRLQWFVSRTAEGYMPQGECFSNITLKPHLSTMCEPITGAAYLMAAMAYSGQYDMRVYSPQVNAGVFKEITVNSGCSGDWSQWANVPYYTDPVGDSQATGNYSYDLKRVALANDDNNIYLKLDLSDWALPEYQDTDVFAVQVYADTTAETVSSSNVSLTGEQMAHNMSYMVMRSSNSNEYEAYTFNGAAWAKTGAITSVLAPQWESGSGRIEMAIPYTSIASGVISSGDWVNLRIVILQKDGNTWVEADSFDAHYRKTTNGMEWLKGNFQ